MSINDILPTELARHRQNVNPAKAQLPSSHGIARQKVDRLKDAVLIPEVDSAAYFDEYNIEDLH